MSGRETLLAEIEARRRAQAEKDEIEILAADLSIADEDKSYNPYDKPGHAKPLDPETDAAERRKMLRQGSRRR